MSCRQRINRIITTLVGSPADSRLDPNDTSYHIIREIFTNGNCGNFAVVLADVFNGRICATNDHAFTEITIDGVPTYWDITGEIFPPSVTYVTEQQLIDMMLYDNYSFDYRGALA